MDTVAELCERSIVLHEGRVAADGPSHDIFRDDPLLARCRLEKLLAMQACTLYAGPRHKMDDCV